MRKIEIEEQRNIYLGLLDNLDSFCKQHNLKYFLAYGTLIGAVRHHGFIPWDDDVDVFMPRNDYMRMLQIYNNKNNRYKLFHFTNNNSIRSRMIYFVDSKTRRKSSYQKDFVENLGMNIDIFPVDNVPDSMLFRLIHRWRVSILDSLFNIKMIPISPYRNKAKNIVIETIQIILKPVTFSFLEKRLDYVASMYIDKNTTMCNVFYSPYDQKKSFYVNDFSESVKCQFENREFDIPVGYDSILKKTYGDYMKLPPESDRLPHNDHMEYFVVD